MTAGLSVAEWCDPPDEEVVVDPYIAFAVRWGKFESPFWSPRRYSRTGNLRTSMLEIGVDEKTGVLLSVTLVLNDRAATTTSEDDPPPDLDETVSAIPKLCTVKWPAGQHVDNPGPLNVVLSAHCITARFGTMQPVRYVGTGGRVIFGVDEHQHLVEVRVCDLNDYEIEQIRCALRLSRS